MNDPEQLAYDAEHWQQIIPELRAEIRRQDAYIKRLEERSAIWRPVLEVATFWHRARGMHRAPWLNRLKERIVDMEERHPNALLD